MLSYKKSVMANEKTIELLKSNYERASKYFESEYGESYPRQVHAGLERSTYTKLKFVFGESSDYISYNFNTYCFGGNAAFSEDDYTVIHAKHINQCKFENCDFEKIIFDHCSFHGTQFLKCNFTMAVFKNCLFSFPITEYKTKEKKSYYSPTLFEDCWFSGRIENCDVTHTLFEQVRFSVSEFKGCSFEDSVADKCAFSSVKIKDCNLSNFKLNGTDIFDISFNDNVKSIVNENTFFDYSISFSSKKQKQDIVSDSGMRVEDNKEAYFLKSKSFGAISYLFELNHFINDSGEYYYQYKLLERESLHGINKIKSNFSLLLCGYGERPIFTVISIVVVILAFALLYMFTGINANGTNLNYTFASDGIPVDLLTALIDYGKCIFFSITTFSTVGYGNYLPIGLCSTVLSAFQMITGVGLCALWTGCTLRKLFR